MGQDLATLLLSTVIAQREGKPLYIGLVDIEAAYATTWKEGVWFKLHSRGLRGRVWQLLASILSKYPTYIKCDGEISELLEILKGLPQGSSLSGLCFTAFLGDLVEILKKEGHGVNRMGVTLAAILFMDDLTLLADSEQQMIAILELLTKYGVTWRLKFADKSEVLVLGVSDPRQEWQLGGQTIKTTSAGKMLGVWYSADGKPNKHIEARMEKAWATWHAAKKVGLVGGRVAYADQQMFTHQVVWATLDYGRQVASTYGHGHRALRNKLDSMQRSMGGTILGASRFAATAGILGEHGWWPDSARHVWKLLCTEKWLIMHKDSAWGKLLVAHKSSVQLFKLCDTIRIYFQPQGVGEDTSLENWKATVKRQLHQRVENDWRASMDDHPSLWLYKKYKTLETTGFAFLRNFKGRSELSRARIADIDFFGHVMVPMGNGNWECPWCPQKLSAFHDESQHRYELAYHVTLGCPGRRRETMDLLGTATKWWPADWAALPWYEQIAYFLQLAGAQPPEAAVVVGSHLYDALKEGHEARERIVRLRAGLA